jgi:hypothetical protein
MHNAHVMTYYAHRSRVCNALLAKMARPDRNIARPMRYTARLMFHRLIVETIRSYDPEGVLRHEWTPMHFH